MAGERFPLLAVDEEEDFFDRFEIEGQAIDDGIDRGQLGRRRRTDACRRDPGRNRRRPFRPW